MNSTIKQTKLGKSTLYCAKDVYEHLGIAYRHADSLDALSTGYSTATFLTKVGNRNINISQYALTQKAINELAKKHGKPVQGQVLMKAAAATKSLQTLLKAASVVKNDPLQIQARKQTRIHVQDYADKRADELEIDAAKRSVFFDLSFKALYDAFKLSNKDRIDLKAIADTLTEQTKTKVSGLQVAERLDLAIELLEFAKSFYTL